MSIPRFYVPAPLPASGHHVLPEDVAHHAGRVLRLAAGDPIVLFDGTGGEYHASLGFDGKRAYARIERHVNCERELAGTLRLAQGIASGDKMEWIVEKAVELGVAQIQPIAAQRSVLRLQGERLDKRLAQWRRTAIAAAEQCGRNRVPALAAPGSLAQYLREPPAGALLLCHPDATQSLGDALAHVRPEPGATLLVGPEGGWSDEELAIAARAGAQRVRFGSRVLRTETAGLALLAASAALLGWQDQEP
ncbi:16S rRNA (uracil(1498)-N(3))-methyltransferase [Verticiella sediminum]|uniref:Ribosomal RNA small subunit methyltransferase E n=1 Tax=Verticiella sediminum TaxID=1247510 RepID=A0A556AVP9_9BURK|nr:16S rRNA (uracil(1498)-N(3))-methyltransferase [Verticiella sediminum]TSH97029.1 16S rRNA (uracil(1498)-N(3))-methyltransferase [Verticiella sediminum]